MPSHSPDTYATVPGRPTWPDAGVSAAINELMRSGLGRADVAAKPFEQRTSKMGALIDAHLAALRDRARAHLCSTDTDFTRFKELRWIDPVTS